MPLASDIEGVIEAENEGLTCCDVLREEVQELKWAVLAVACCLTFGGYYIYDFPGTLGTGLTDTIEERFRESDKLYTQGMNQALYSVYSWPNLILSVVGGLLIDRYLGLRRAMLLFTGIILLGSILFYWGVRFVCFPLMLAGRVIFGFGGESLAVAQSAYVARWFRNGRGMALAFGITISCSRVGSSFNFIFAPLIAHHWGVCAAALSGVMACVLSLLACIVLVCADVHAVRIGYIRPEVRDADDDTQTKAPVMRLSDAARLPLVFWLMCIICMCCYTAIFPFIGIGKNFLEVKYGYPGYTAAKYMSSYQLSSAISSPLIGLIVDTMGRNTLWLILASFLFVMVHVLFMVTSIPGLVLLLAMGCFYSFLVSGLWPSIPLAVEENIVGFSYGLMTAIQNIGLATMPFVVGKILDGYVEKPSHPDVSGSSGLLSSSSSNSDTSGGKTGLPSLEGFMLTEVVFAATAAVSLFASVLLLVVDFRSKGILSASSSDRKAFLMLVSDRTPLLGVATEEASDENACIPPTETNVPTVHTEVNMCVQNEQGNTS